MRILQLVKTSEGAKWAVHQVSELVKLGVEVHVALPSLRSEGVSPAQREMLAEWKRSGARLHEADVDFSPARPLRIPGKLARMRSLVAETRPELIHSHFVGTSLTMRLALGRRSAIPRIYQVAGPLHLEHLIYRHGEIGLAGPGDYWIGSSRFINSLYREAGVAAERLFLSYYATYLPDNSNPAARSGPFRRRLGIGEGAQVVGNINYMYPPKRYLGQRLGLKRHELVIDAIARALPRNPKLVGVLAGGAWGGAQAYEEALRARAQRAGGERIRLPGRLKPDEVAGIWPEYDLAVHVPLSENCGGVVEPMLAGVPVIASKTGGLPELVIPGRTGELVEGRTDEELTAALTEAICRSLAEPERARALARNGKRLVESMFDVRRTAREVFAIYDHVLNGRVRPAEFESERFEWGNE